MCGEQQGEGYEPSLTGGSPPRVRGTVALGVFFCFRLGITPACAGNRLKKARHFYILFCQIKRIHLV